MDSTSHEVLLSGILEKRGATFGKWVRRYYYIILHSGTYKLCYKRHPGEKHFHGELLLNAFDVLLYNDTDLTSVTSSFLPSATGPLFGSVQNKSHAFMIETQERVVLLRAPNVKERSRWVGQLTILKHRHAISQTISENSGTGAQARCSYCNVLTPPTIESYSCDHCHKLFCFRTQCINPNFYGMALCTPCQGLVTESTRDYDESTLVFNGNTLNNLNQTPTTNANGLNTALVGYPNNNNNNNQPQYLNPLHANALGSATTAPHSVTGLTKPSDNVLTLLDPSALADQGSDEVIVSVLKGSGLAFSSTLSVTTCRPYCLIKVDGNTTRTKTVTGADNPNWDFSCQFPLSKGTQNVHIAVYHNDRFGSHTLLGKVSIPITHLEKRRIYEAWFSLSNSKGSGVGHLGKILVQIIRLGDGQLSSLDIAHQRLHDTILQLEFGAIWQYLGHFISFESPVLLGIYYLLFCLLVLHIPAEFVATLVPVAYLVVVLASLLDNLILLLAKRKANFIIHYQREHAALLQQLAIDRILNDEQMKLTGTVRDNYGRTVVNPLRNTVLQQQRGIFENLQKLQEGERRLEQLEYNRLESQHRLVLSQRNQHIHLNDYSLDNQFNSGTSYSPSSSTNSLQKRNNEPGSHNPIISAPLGQHLPHFGPDGHLSNPTSQQLFSNMGNMTPRGPVNRIAFQQDWQQKHSSVFLNRPLQPQASLTSPKLPPPHTNNNNNNNNNNNTPHSSPYLSSSSFQYPTSTQGSARSGASSLGVNSNPSNNNNNSDDDQTVSPNSTTQGALDHVDWSQRIVSTIMSYISLLFGQLITWGLNTIKNNVSEESWNNFELITDFVKEWIGLTLGDDLVRYSSSYRYNHHHHLRNQLNQQQEFTTADGLNYTLIDKNRKEKRDRTKEKKKSSNDSFETASIRSYFSHTSRHSSRSRQRSRTEVQHESNPSQSGLGGLLQPQKLNSTTSLTSDPIPPSSTSSQSPSQSTGTSQSNAQQQQRRTHHARSQSGVLMEGLPDFSSTPLGTQPTNLHSIHSPSNATTPNNQSSSSFNGYRHRRNGSSLNHPFDPQQVKASLFSPNSPTASQHNTGVVSSSITLNDPTRNVNLSDITSNPSTVTTSRTDSGYNNHEDEDGDSNHHKNHPHHHGSDNNESFHSDSPTLSSLDGTSHLDDDYSDDDSLLSSLSSPHDDNDDGTNDHGHPGNNTGKKGGNNSTRGDSNDKTKFNPLVNGHNIQGLSTKPSHIDHKGRRKSLIGLQKPNRFVGSLLDEMKAVNDLKFEHFNPTGEKMKGKRDHNLTKKEKNVPKSDQNGNHLRFPQGSPSSSPGSSSSGDINTDDSIDGNDGNDFDNDDSDNEADQIVGIDGVVVKKKHKPKDKLIEHHQGHKKYHKPTQRHIGDEDDSISMGSNNGMLSPIFEGDHDGISTNFSILGHLRPSHLVSAGNNSHKRHKKDSKRTKRDNWEFKESGITLNVDPLPSADDPDEYNSKTPLSPIAGGVRLQFSESDAEGEDHYEGDQKRQKRKMTANMASSSSRRDHPNLDNNSNQFNHQQQSNHQLAHQKQNNTLQQQPQEQQQQQPFGLLPHDQFYYGEVIDETNHFYPPPPPEIKAPLHKHTKASLELQQDEEEVKVNGVVDEVSSPTPKTLQNSAIPDHLRFNFENHLELVAGAMPDSVAQSSVLYTQQQQQTQSRTNQPHSMNNNGWDSINNPVKLGSNPKQQASIHHQKYPQYQYHIGGPKEDVKNLPIYKFPSKKRYATELFSLVLVLETISWLLFRHSKQNAQRLYVDQDDLGPQLAPQLYALKTTIFWLFLTIVIPTRLLLIFYVTYLVVYRFLTLRQRAIHSNG